LGYPKKRKKPLAVVIPSSYATQSKNNQIYTFRVGLLARACSIFRVDKIFIYLIEDSLKERKNARKLVNILKYIQTPQYLRKYLFKKSKNLIDVGVVPPLGVPAHPKRDETKLKFRFGYVIRSEDNGFSLDAGLSKYVFVKERSLKMHELYLLKITRKKGRYFGRVVAPQSVPYYLVYDIHLRNEILDEALSYLKSKKYYIIGTSRHGKSIVEMQSILLNQIKDQRKIAIVFGGPKLGIFDIITDTENISSYFDIILNFIPKQGVRIVHADEAIFSVLSILNVLLE